MRPALDLVLLGEPGVGKTTQARKLAPVFGLAPLSMGHLIYSGIKSQESWAEEAKVDFEKGKPVSDKIVNRILADALDQPDTQRGVIFDGYPRSISQAVELDALLRSRERKLAATISLEVPRLELMERIALRLVCENCGEIYHQELCSPLIVGRCDICKENSLVRRSDDHEEAVEGRFRAFHRQSLDLLEYYHHQNLLKRIDAAKPIDAVAHDLQVVVLSVGGVPSETAVKEM